MKLSELDRRNTQLREIMDDPECEPAQLRRTLERFGIVNFAVARWGRVYRTHIRPALSAARATGGAELRLLDIGCGGGDVLRRLVRRARRDGYRVSGLGIDPDPRAIAVARAAAPLDGVRYRECFSDELAASGARFDVVLSNHLLHHLETPALEALLADSERLADRLAVHSDIARGRFAYAAFSIGVAPVSRGTLLRVDGLRSIRRSYRAAELSDALPADWHVERVGPFRLLAVHRPKRAMARCGSGRGSTDEWSEPMSGLNR